MYFLFFHTLTLGIKVNTAARPVYRDEWNRFLYNSKIM